jgi:hypothetical protein
MDRGVGLPPPPPPLPLGVPELAHSLAEVARYLAEIMANSQRQGRNERREGCSSRSFKHNSPVFIGHERPREVDSWFEANQKLMLALNCTDA